MTTHSFTGLLLLASLVSAALTGCGEDGQAVGDGQCPQNPEMPLFRYLRRPPAPGELEDTFIRVHQTEQACTKDRPCTGASICDDGRCVTPLTSQENLVINSAETSDNAARGNARCLTPSGDAITLGADAPKKRSTGGANGNGGTGGTTGAGGAGPADAAAD